MRETFGHSEPDRLPPFFLEVVAVKVRNSAVRVGHLQAWPGAVTIALGVQAKSDRRSVNGLGLLSSQVEASGGARRREVVLHANSRLPVLSFGLGDLTGGTVTGGFKHRWVGEVPQGCVFCAVSYRHRDGQVSHGEGDFPCGGLTGGAHGPGTQAVVFDFHSASGTHLDVGSLNAGLLAVTVEPAECDLSSRVSVWQTE